MIWPPANAIYRRETHDNYPAAKAILASVYEGLQLPMDLALRVESRYFAHILRSKEAAAMKLVIQPKCSPASSWVIDCADTPRPAPTTSAVTISKFKAPKPPAIPANKPAMMKDR